MHIYAGQAKRAENFYHCPHGSMPTKQDNGRKPSQLPPSNTHVEMLISSMKTLNFYHTSEATEN